MKIKKAFSKIKNSLSGRMSRNQVLLLSALLGLYVLIIPALIWERASSSELFQLKAKFAEFSILSAEYRSLKEQVGSIEQKSFLTKTSGIAQALDDAFLSLGVKGKMKSIKGIGGREIKDQLNEEAAEVQMEKVDLNELVNIFYKLENAPLLLSIQKVALRKSFEKPDLLDVTITVSLFTSPAAGL
ncbi:MAG: hypothetical protein KKD92_14520 [Proteobacteria bacterium]|nr:hypothetical protein [Pseudomonadota bacterium]